MEIIDILSNDRGHFARLHQVDNSEVTVVRLCLQYAGTVFKPLPPGLLPSLVRPDKLLVIYRFIAGPEAARTTKIRYPRFGADSGSCKHHCRLAVLEQFSKPVHLGHHNIL